MQFDDFRWKGILASAMGVMIQEMPQYVKPQQRTNPITVLGRSGTLTPRADLGYEPVSYTVQCALAAGADRQAVYTWLQGSGMLILGSLPEYAYEAEITAQIDYRLFVDGDEGGWEDFTVIWSCQPYRYQASPDANIEIDGGAEQPVTIHNPGNVDAAPIITLHDAEGDITLTIGGQAVKLESIEDGCIIDCDMLDCCDMDRANLLNAQMTGDFPTIPPGDSQLTWTLGDGSQVTKIEIQPMWRWI